jgi:hypothetical protein
MMRRVQCSYPKLFLALAFAAAVAVAACAGSRDGETVSGSSRIAVNADPGTPMADTGTVGASGAQERYPICHKGHELWIPLDAWPDHEAHGDQWGGCDTCPCFTADEIETAAACATSPPSCSPGDPYFLIVVCGKVADSYLTSSPAELNRCIGFTNVEGITLDQHNACVAELEATDYCP